MKYLTRYLTLSLSVAALAASIGVAQADDWFSLNLFGDQSAQPIAASVTVTPTTAVQKTDAPVQVAARKLGLKDGSYQGQSVDAYYGMVQVQANIQAGRLISVDVLDYPNHRNTSRAINRQALPMLEREVIGAQSARVNMISGATLTSQAYLRSLYGALKQASM